MNDLGIEFEMSRRPDEQARAWRLPVYRRYK